MPRSDDLKNRLEELFSTMSATDSDMELPGRLANPAGLSQGSGEPPLPQPVFQAEDARMRGAGVLDSAFEHLAVGMILTSLDGRLIKVNEAFCQLVGYENSELEGVSFQSLTHPDDLKVGADAMRAMLSGAKTSARFEKRYIRKDKQVVWVELNVTLIRDAYNKPSHFVAIALDVSNQHVTSAMLEKHVQELNYVMDATPDWIFVKDRDHRFLTVNKSFANALHRTKEEFIGKDDIELGFPEDAVMGDPEKGIRGYWWDDEHVLTTGEPKTTLGEKNYLNGELHYFDVFKTAMRDKQGNVIGLMGYARDVTDRERLLNEVQQRAQSLRMFQNGLENSTEAVFMTDTHGVITYVNPGFEKTYGYTREEAIGQTPRIIKSGFIPLEGYQQFWQKLLNGEIVAGEIVNKCKDGRIIPVEGSNVPIKDDDGKIVGFLAVHRDITERKQAEEKLANHAAQLATVAEVSADVARILNPHELLQSVTKRTKEKFGLYHAHIYLLDGAQKALELAAGADEVGQEMLRRGWRISLSQEQSLVAQAARSRKAVVVDDVQSNPDFLPNDLLPDTRSELAVPLVVGDDVLGVLDVQSDVVGRFKQDDISIMTTLASQVAVALQNARRYMEIQSSAQRERVLREISERVRASSDADAILRTTVRELGVVLGRRTFIRLVRAGDVESAGGER
jgi:PAS domain S-box-containing protein